MVPCDHALQGMMSPLHLLGDILVPKNIYIYIYDEVHSKLVMQTFKGSTTYKER